MRRLVFTAIFVATFAFADGGAPILWRDPGSIASLDLAAGPGGRYGSPRPPFTFVKEEMDGSAPKVLVRDSRGVHWSVKFGEEAKPEAFASRIAWAAGYFAEPAYLLREGEIAGAGNLVRAARFVQNGRFRDGRFELRNDAVIKLVPGSRWTLEEAALKHTKELSGLKLVIMLVSNWDVKADNMAVFEQGGQRFYGVTDWGASMGATGDISGRSKWDCAGYTKQTEHFVNDVADGYVYFNYAGKDQPIVTNNVRTEHVKWFMDRMGKLTDAQVRTALDASGATPEEAACFVPAFRTRLGQLTAAASGQGGAIRSRTVTTTTTKKTTTTTTK